MTERRDAGIREIVVAVGHIEVTLREHDVVVEHDRVMRKVLLQRAVEGPDQVEHGRVVADRPRFLQCRLPLLICRRRSAVELRQHLFEHVTDVGMDRQIRTEHATDLAGVEIDLGNPLTVEQTGIPQITGAFVVTDTEKNQQIGLLHDIAARLAVRRHAQAAERQR